MSNIFKLNLKDIVGGAVSAGIVALLGALLANPDSIEFLTFHPILSTAILATVASLLKSLSTDSEGKFVGVVKIK